MWLLQVLKFSVQLEVGRLTGRKSSVPTRALSLQGEEDASNTKRFGLGWENSCGIQATCGPSPLRNFWPLKEDFWWGSDGFNGAGVERASNMWQMCGLNSVWTPLSHCGTAWESLANVQRDGERVFTSLVCSYMRRCWMKRCLNTERTWGFWLHQRHPRYFDFVFLSFRGWWVHPAAAVATAANNQSNH